MASVLRRRPGSMPRGYVGLPWPVWTHHRKLIVAGRMPRTVRRSSAELHGDRLIGVRPHQGASTFQREDARRRPREVRGRCGCCEPSAAGGCGGRTRAPRARPRGYASAGRELAARRRPEGALARGLRRTARARAAAAAATATSGRIGTIGHTRPKRERLRLSPTFSPSAD